MDLKSFLTVVVCVTVLLVVNNKQRKFRQAKENAYWRGLIDRHTRDTTHKSRAE
jgi:hypothetical protein